MVTIDANRLENLPLELLENIIEELPILDILRVGRVRNSICLHLTDGFTEVYSTGESLFLRSYSSFSSDPAQD